MRQAAKTIFWGQTFLYAGLLVCVLLKPGGLAANAGISYYGTYRATFFPFAVGLLGAVYFAVRSVVVGIVITPYAAGWLMSDLHTACGSALFALQLALSGWLAWRLRYAWWSIGLTLVELAAGIASAIYLYPTHGFLFQSQVVFQLAFGALLITSLRRVPPVSPGSPS